MTKKARVYITLVSALGLAILAISVYHFCQTVNGVPFERYGWRLVFLTALCAACRSFPITIRQNQGLDLSVIAILSAFLSDGMEAAMLVYVLSSLFTFERQGDGQLHSIYNISLVKTIFNTSDIIIAILIPGLICQLLPWQPGNMAFPIILLPTLIFALLSFFFNYLVLLAMFRLNGEMTSPEMYHILLSLTPNVIAAMPLGLIFALLLSLPMGAWLALLMICPMLLARYAWKLYLEATRHKAELITALVSAVEARDAYTQGHSVRVSEYAEKLARQMELKEREIALIHEGALLHDIGKIGISDQILHKNGPLTPEEWAVMKRHPLIGAEMAAKAGLEPGVNEMILSHHERYDGTGYPNARPIAECSVATRIMGVADAFDAMTSDRPYRRGMPVTDALNELRRGRGTQFDPAVVDAMLSIMAQPA